jgi:hypothetical protein
MKHANTPPGVVTAAVAYATRGWSVLPIGEDKRPAVATWKSRQKDAAKPEDVAGWFDRVSGVSGVGIVLGAVSGGLVVRDFDDADGYAKWSKAFPKQAETLPTVKTGRGLHVYFRCAGVKTRTCGDGELRGEGAYVVAPPSKHPSGTYYEWLVPLPEGDVPLVDPTAAGLDRRWAGVVEVPSVGETERTERTETPEKTERTEDTEDTQDTEEPEAIALGWSDETKKCIHDAVIRTLPPAFGQRNWHVFRLARALKAIPAVACLTPQTLRALRPVVKDWHQRGRDKMLTKDFGTTWGDFAHAWPRVKFAEGDDVIGKARERAEAADPPAWTADYDPRQKLLASLCRELQRTAGAEPFFLGARLAGGQVGVDKDTANRWLRAFVADGALVEVQKGTKQSGKATRWRYVAKDL